MDVAEPDGAGEAVEQRDAEEEERRGERPSRKYFSAASWESSRRRRASPHIRYSGSENTSSATNMVSRSLAATNSIMPPSANRVSGKTSVCTPARLSAARRSPRLPTVMAARATNATARSSDRSAISSSATMPSTGSVPCRNRAGPSTATAPSAVIRACRRERARADDSAPSDADQGEQRPGPGAGLARGTNASTSTPTQAAPNRISIGASAA